jgi:hypothetical protein
MNDWPSSLIFVFARIAPITIFRYSLVRTMAAAIAASSLKLAAFS